MSNTREVPFIPYYGSVDSTPLALILLHEYVNWTMDLSRLKEWWPDALNALEWMDRYGDSDGDGFLEYEKRSPTGLPNQGWKDSTIRSCTLMEGSHPRPFGFAKFKPTRFAHEWA